ncbi:MAG: M56/M15 family metallopeptidase [Bacteroidota bacterium]
MAILPVLLKVIVSSSLLWCYYWLLLRNKKFHGYNRLYLLVSAVLPMVIPFIEIPVYAPVQQPQNIIIRTVVTVAEAHDFATGFTNDYPLDFAGILFAGFLLVAIYFALRLLIGLYTIWKLQKQHPGRLIDNIIWHQTTHKLAPFSFFNHLFWHSDIDASTPGGNEILHHELSHIYQWHSIDKMLLEVLTCINFWNPFFWLIRRELSHIHEFIADEDASRVHNGRLAYAENLLKTAIIVKNQGLIHSFFSPPIKRRIVMLLNTKNTRWSNARRWSILPLMLIMTVLVTMHPQLNAQDALVKEKNIKLVIDAGHGGNDNGALATDNTTEKDLALRWALSLKKAAESRGIEVIMTRSTDALPGNTTDKIEGLKNRIKFDDADCFVSIHMNAAERMKDQEHGLQLFIASKDNNGQVEKSKVLGSGILSALESGHYDIHKNIKQNTQGVYVLDQNKLPSVLIEVGFLTNEKELALIKDAGYQQGLVEKIVAGILQSAANNFTPGSNSGSK